MTYTPDIRSYQQLHSGDPFGYADCTAWAAALVTDAHTKGGTKLTGTQVRRATDEPRPDPASPGLNLPQVDAAVRHLTSGKVDLDTRLGLSKGTAQSLIVDGRWAIVQVDRGVLVRRGFLEGFTGKHALTVHVLDDVTVPILGDPLVPYYVRASWPAVWAAASSLIGLTGKANLSLTRDLSPDYSMHVAAGRRYALFTVKADRIVTRPEVRVSRNGFSSPCTPPRFYPWTGHVGRSLVQITGGKHAEAYVRSYFADEVIP